MCRLCSLLCLWPRWCSGRRPHGCSGRRRARPPARLGVLTSFGAAPRSPPVPSGPSGALHTSGAWCADVRFGASARCPARPRHRPMGAAARPRSCGLPMALHGRQCARLKPPSPLLARVGVGLKPPSPLRVGNGLLWCSFWAHRCHWFQRFLPRGEHWCHWFQSRNVGVCCTRLFVPAWPRVGASAIKFALRRCVVM